MTDIEQQARKEAEEYCERVHPYAVSFGLKETIITCHAEALISERSKPTATCEPIYGDYGGINRYSCSNCGAPIGPPEFSRYCGNCARKVLWPEGANYQTHPPKPSLMVGFSEEADGWRYKTPHGWVVTKTKTSSDSQPLFANTRAVSIDRIMEEIADVLEVHGLGVEGNANAVLHADLRERLMKIAP